MAAAGGRFVHADGWRQAKRSPPRAVIGQFTSAAAVWPMLIASAVAAVS
jgi:hypothetical protein